MSAVVPNVRTQEWPAYGANLRASRLRMSLKNRCARGEIDKQEFKEKNHDFD